MRLRLPLRSLAAVVALSALAACSGGGSAPPAPPLATSAPVTSAGTTQVAFTFTFPASGAATSSSARLPAYVSPSIKSLAITVDGGTATYVNAPTPTGSPQTVTTTIPVGPGSHQFTIAEYDATNGGGALLGRVSQTNQIQAGVLNQLAFTVNGQLAKIVVQAPTSPFLEGSFAAGFTLVGAGPQVFTAVPEDADGNTIVSPGSIPQLTVASASPNSVIATPLGGNTFSLRAPVPTQDRAFVAISVTGTNLDGATVAAPNFGVSGEGAFYVADYGDQVVRVFDEFGTPLKLPTTAFKMLSNPEGLAYVPGDPGSVVVTETANFGAPYILAFDQAGNAQTLASTSAFAGLSRPLFLTYAPTAGGAGEFVVPDYFTGSVSTFDPKGAALPAPGGKFSVGLDPVAAAYDPHDGQIYVTNDGSDSITRYDASGTLLGSATTGSHPMGVAYDSNNQSFYVAYGGTEGATIDGGTPQNPGITQFSETLVAAANTGGFTNTKAMSYFTGIAVDPYLKQVYVADAGGVAIDAFSETGSAVTLPTGAFSTISTSNVPVSNPMAILFVP